MRWTVKVSRKRENLVTEFILFQNGRHFSTALFSCKLTLVASFLNSKIKRIFSHKRDNKG